MLDRFISNAFIAKRGLMQRLVLPTRQRPRESTATFNHCSSISIADIAGSRLTSKFGFLPPKRLSRSNRHDENRSLNRSARRFGDGTAGDACDVISMKTLNMTTSFRSLEVEPLLCETSNYCARAATSPKVQKSRTAVCAPIAVRIERSPGTGWVCRESERTRIMRDRSENVLLAPATEAEVSPRLFHIRACSFSSPS